jgi:hypothetical protein
VGAAWRSTPFFDATFSRLTIFEKLEDKDVCCSQKSNARVELQVKGRKLQAIAEQIEGELRSQMWEQLIEQAPGYADYAKRTTRDIPMMILRPKVS